jgi:glutamate carboxypeptidase
MRRTAFHLPSSRLARALALGGLLALGSAAHAEPDARLLAAAQKAQPALVEHLKELVLIESGSQQKDGLLKMADGLEKRLQALGFKTERIHATAGAGADNLVATLKGSGKRKIMLQGHMDTVYPPGILATQPYKVDGNRIYGPGIADDKGGLAVIVAGLQILQDAGWRDFDTLTVLMNPDEEVGSQGSSDLITRLADQHDVVLSFEPSAGRPRPTTSCCWARRASPRPGWRSRAAPRTPATRPSRAATRSTSWRIAPCRPRTWPRTSRARSSTGPSCTRARTRSTRSPPAPWPWATCA